jgi:hypothetical protein
MKVLLNQTIAEWFAGDGLRIKRNPRPIEQLEERCLNLSGRRLISLRRMGKKAQS